MPSCCNSSIHAAANSCISRYRCRTTWWNLSRHCGVRGDRGIPPPPSHTCVSGALNRRFAILICIWT
ncbi:hypothetical protein RHECNPAF_3500070 [Rhizobium etli CNPAF512]|nr:hypothetical protein RHECNPAF_3500070 [Rhizobium etli CNPAF512]